MSGRRNATAERVRTAPPPAADERTLQRERVVAALDGDAPPLAAGRLAQLSERFGLDAFESDVLAVLWVGAFDPELRAQLATREPFACQITVRLVAALFGHPPRVRLPSESPLLLWQMVEEHVLIDGTAALTIDAAMIAWLEGDHELDRCLAGRAQLLPPAIESPQWPLEATARRLHEGLQRGLRWRVHLDTDDALAARWFACALGRRLGLPVLDVPAGALAGEADAAVRLHRQAFLDACIPCIALDDVALSRPAGVLPYALQFVHGQGPLTPSMPLVQDLDCRVPHPDAAERERLWRHCLAECAAWPCGEVAELALCHEASLSDIAAAAGTGPADAQQAAQALRERTRGDLGPLARRMECSFQWDDLVLPTGVNQRLKEIAFEARERGRVWADPAAARLFPYGRGLVALFAGAPGTGKTMAAQVIAGDLGLDLLAVDLSAVVSKWVGETAQHLQQLLSSRAAQRSVLFFDEADALYAKRVEEVRDAQDRFANLDSSHLMTALESYPGIVLLASNLKANIDGAFLRRIRHVVDFPKPAADARERIWRQVVRALFTPAQARRLDAELPRIARAEATGAVIKNAALSALFAARHAQREPTLRLLGEMLARELAKEGAGLSERELQALLEGAR
ncbi:MAG TPA: ATP-binding protein [Albitalea sp.]